MPPLKRAIGAGIPPETVPDDTPIEAVRDLGSGAAAMDHVPARSAGLAEIARHGEMLPPKNRKGKEDGPRRKRQLRPKKLPSSAKSHRPSPKYFLANQNQNPPRRENPVGLRPRKNVRPPKKGIARVAEAETVPADKGNKRAGVVQGVSVKRVTHRASGLRQKNAAANAGLAALKTAAHARTGIPIPRTIQANPTPEGAIHG